MVNVYYTHIKRPEDRLAKTQSHRLTDLIHLKVLRAITKNTTFDIAQVDYCPAFNLLRNFLNTY